MSPLPKPKEQRRAPRHDVCHSCDVDPPDGSPFLALIVNISPFGCMMRAKSECAPGSRLTFRLPVAGRQTARIIWSLGGRMGMEFEKPIDPEPYLAMLERMVRSGDEMGIY